MKNSFIEDYSSKISDNALGKLNKSIGISSVDLKIKATHSGRINGNKVFYTPRSMMQGVKTLTQPFNKHLQKGHNGEAVGPITDAKYLDYTNQYPELLTIADSINTAATDKDLVKAVKELTNHPAYKKSDFLGLGATEVYATIYDEELIQDIRSGESRGQVSIGGKSNRVLCSICTEHMTPKHKHTKGKTYNSETCFAIYDVMMLDHIGFVPDPADNETSSEIISDSLENDIKITIENYKIQDNIQRNTPSMFITIAQLKELAKDPSKFVGTLNLADSKSKEIEETLKASLKYTRESNYLIPGEKLLPINTELAVATTKAAIDLLEESKEKTELLDLLQIHLDAKFKESSLEDFLAQLVVPTTVEDVVAAITTPAVEGAVAAVVKTEEELAAEAAASVENVVSKVTGASLSDSDLDRIVTAITTKVTESIKPLVETQTGIQDSLDKNTYSLLLDRNKSLENDIRTVETAITQLTSDYRDVIIGQILEKKNLDKTSPYFVEVLSKRDVQGLKDTLVDLQFSPEVKAVVAVQAAAVEPIQKLDIQDSLSKDLVVEDATKTQTDVTIKDALDTPEAFRAEVSRVGLAQALKNRKK